jgi:DNA invertase Pin-like site-specific DNA recombinase
MPAFVSYLRVSTTKQGISGLGLEAQRDAVARYVAAAGGDLLAERVEIEAGSKCDRPGLNSALAECRRVKATLVIAKLDRLARNVHFISGLMEARVAFVAVDMPAATPLVLHVMAAFAQYEREQIGERTKAALAAAKARGVVLGSNGRKLALVRRAEASAFARLCAATVSEVQAEGATTLQQIADGMNRRGSRTREGSEWSPATVRRVLGRLAV